MSVYDAMSSADGKWFSFGANEGMREGLYLVRSDGTRLHRIARDFDLSPYFEIVKFNIIEEIKFDYRKIMWAEDEPPAGPVEQSA